MDALERAYLSYHKKPITQFVRLKVETNASSKNFPVRALNAAESAGVHAAVHATFRRPVEARAAIAAAGVPIEAPALNSESFYTPRAMAQTDAERGAAEELMDFLTRQPQI